MEKQWVREAMAGAGSSESDSDSPTSQYVLFDARTGLAVREASESDAPDLAGIGARAFQHGHAAIFDPLDIVEDVAARFSEARLRVELRDPDAHWLVALWSGASCGFAHLQSATAPLTVGTRLPIELRGVYVAPDWVGHGVGSSLVRGAISMAAGLGYGSLWTCVANENEPAKAFFRHCGFSEASKMPSTVGRRSRARLLVMSRLVSPGAAAASSLSPSG